MKHKFLLIVLISIFSAVSAQTTREDIYCNIAKTGGVYYAYPGPTTLQTSAPKGYKPFYINHYGRHGSRWSHNDSDYFKVKEVFDVAAEVGVLTQLGEDVHKRLIITCEDARLRAGDLSEVGVRQQYGIAERMYKSFPEVFKSNHYIQCRSTRSVRCVLSMAAFSERLKELNPDLKITREASRRYETYLSCLSPESYNMITDPNQPWRKKLDQYIADKVHPQRLMKSLFSNEVYVKDNIDEKKLMSSLWVIASTMQGTDLDISFYDIFTKEELFDLWMGDNANFYVLDGPSPYVGKMLVDNAKYLLDNFIKSSDAAIKGNGISASLRFGHDSNIIPFAAIMEIENCNIITEYDDDELYKKWCNFLIAPMAGNIQWIFFKKKGSNNILVKFLLNENEVRIPVETKTFPYYDWDKVKAFYQEKLDKIMK